jgi:glycosyltransferase involved in cell wall biosynthesis
VIEESQQIPLDPCLPKGSLPRHLKNPSKRGAGEIYSAADFWIHRIGREDAKPGLGANNQTRIALSPIIEPSGAALFPLVTIALPTYNRAISYLPQALGSALSQTYSNLEIVVSDNCSTDGTRALVSGIEDPRLRYFRHERNIGANNNFNFCFEQANGSYVLLLHDDDIIDHDFVASCIQAVAGSTEPGIIRTGTRLIDSDGKVIREIPNIAAGLPTDAFFRAWLSAKTALYLCSILFNTKRLREIGGFRSKHNCYEDGMAEFRLIAKYGRVDVPEVKASFRYHEGQQAFGRSIDEWCQDSVDLLDLMCELAPDSKAQLRHDGLQFFSRANYRRASAMHSPMERIVAYAKVFGYFGCLPSFRRLVDILYGTRSYSAVRFLKRKLMLVSSES